MNRRKTISQRWRELGITAKFTTAFGLLLALIVLIAIVGIAALTFVHHETDATIVTSTEIQRLVLEMNRDLEKARRLERDFFLRYPTVGFSVAYQKYAQPADEQVMQVRALSAELQQLVSRSDVSAAWQESDVNLNLYLSAASRHAATVEEAAELVARLAADDAASETAQIVAGAGGARIKLAPDLNEADLGVLEGMTVQVFAISTVLLGLGFILSRTLG